MKAKILVREKFTDEDGNLIEYVVWNVPRSHLHPEGVRYRMAFIPRGTEKPAVLYDNHHPKGHHKHISGVEEVYSYSNVHQLMIDFHKDISRWKKAKE